MKNNVLKIALGVLGLGAVLTSCGGDVTTGSGLGIDSSSVTLNSNYITSNNAPVICDNTSTTLTFKFRYYGDLRYVNFELAGSDPSYAINLNNIPVIADGRYATATFTIPNGASPLNLKTAKPQSIIVSPKVIGSAHVNMQGLDSVGGITAVIRSNDLPVISNCQ